MTYFASDSDQICLWKNIYVTPDVNVRTAHSAVHSLCEEKAKTVNGKDLIFDKCRVSSDGQSRSPKLLNHLHLHGPLLHSWLFYHCFWFIFLFQQTFESVTERTKLRRYQFVIQGYFPFYYVTKKKYVLSIFTTLQVPRQVDKLPQRKAFWPNDNNNINCLAHIFFLLLRPLRTKAQYWRPSHL